MINFLYKLSQNYINVVITVIGVIVSTLIIWLYMSVLGLSIVSAEHTVKIDNINKELLQNSVDYAEIKNIVLLGQKQEHQDIMEVQKLIIELKK